MLVKKIFTNIPKIRAKLFLNKLKKIRINKSKYEKLKKHIKKAKNDLLEQQKEKVTNKIYKIYAYHNINKMFNILNKSLNKKTKPYFAKNFLKKLYANLREKKQYKYGNQLKSINKARITKLKFKNEIITNKPDDIVERKSAPMKRCLPHFIRYLERKINITKKKELSEYRKKKKTQNLLLKMYYSYFSMKLVEYILKEHYQKQQNFLKNI